ncbi:MAG: radical SAM protein [Bacteroidales bacterium]|nr:radical SAM protein [Bacteroidales bacterium]
MFPDRITLQWHLTDICNYRCIHCYQDNYIDKGADYKKLLEYYGKMEKLICHFKENNKNIKAHINFTGGEPFMKNELLSLLQILHDNKVFSFGILSNGFLLCKSDLKVLAALKPKFIQLSLEGNESINDSIRGRGSYKQVLKAIKTYNDLDIPVIISFTANTINYLIFSEVVRIARKYKVHKIWTDRYLPNNSNDKLALSTNQLKDFFQIVLNEQKKKITNYFSKTIVSSNRSLQFLITGGQPYSCSAGLSLLAIMPNGDVLPCRRLPIKIGNLNYDNLIEIYQSNSTLNGLRSFDNIDTNCMNCYYCRSCKGGLKCLSYINYGDYNKKDSNCWL